MPVEETLSIILTLIARLWKRKNWYWR